MSVDPVVASAAPASSSAGSSLTAEHLTAGYGGSPIIRDLSLRVAPGEIVSVVGPNGSGKSTLMKALIGLVTILEGTVRLGGRDVTGLATEEMARAGVGYVPQVDDVFPPLTVNENLEIGGYLLARSEVSANLDRVYEVFPQLASMRARRAGKLSGGERKMLAMGRVLMLRPSLVVLDEPTANLAPLIADAVLGDHVRRLAETGCSVLVVEQRARAVLEISDRTYVLAGGEVQMEGTPAELSANPDFVGSFLGARPR